jgi:hypothetical protein
LKSAKSGRTIESEIRARSESPLTIPARRRRAVTILNNSPTSVNVIDHHTRAHNPGEPRADSISFDSERLGRIVRPLTFILASLCVLQFASWVPHYLTWPLYADHDVFASVAREWNAGKLPYREAFCDNFPGPIYLAWIADRIGGPTSAWPVYAIDAILLVAVASSAVFWSGRELKSTLPGWIMNISLFGYYFSQNYSQTAQRDWQAPLFSLLGILILRSFPRSKPAAIASALCAATAFVFRPQTILFTPIFWTALIDETNDGVKRSIARIFGWSAIAAAMTALEFAPIAIAGSTRDFIGSLAIVSYGGSYHRTSGLRIVSVWLNQFERGDAIALAAALVFFHQAPTKDRRERSLIVSAIASLLLASLYKPLSPYPHEYLNHPMLIFWCWSAAILSSRILRHPRGAELKFIAIGLLIGAHGGLKPEFCNPARSIHALADLYHGDLPLESPAGYTRHSRVSLSAAYRWSDYRNVLKYLRNDLPPDIKIANALKGSPALLAPSGRRSALPAESIAWLRLVNPNDENLFVQSIEACSDSAVVWSPAEFDLGMTPPLKALHSTILRLYRPLAKFGAIEIWERAPDEKVDNLGTAKKAQKVKMVTKVEKFASHDRENRSLSRSKR